MSARRIIFAFVTALLVLSCGTQRRVPRQGDATLADSLWTYSMSHPDGFTLHLASWTNAAEGICVAYEATQSRHSREGLEYVISHAQSNDGYVGGWFSSSDSLYYFDSVRVFPEDSLSAAVRFGKANHQIAIFILSSGEEVLLTEGEE